MDLVGMMMADSRRNAKFLVLTATTVKEWGSGETGAVACGLMTQVYEHPQHPGVMIVHVLNQKHSEQRIREILTSRNFTCEEVQGYDNPNLPFVPPVC